MSEKNSDEANKYYYIEYMNVLALSKMKCFSPTEEDCTSKEKLDLSNPIRRIRNHEINDTLEKNDKIKDIPIPFCLFNLTNNDVITSITCPK